MTVVRDQPAPPSGSVPAAQPSGDGGSPHPSAAASTKAGPWSLLLLLLGLITGGIGAYDAVTAEEFTSRAFGVLLLLAGLVMVIAWVIVCFTEARWRFWIGLTGCVVAGVLSLIFMVMFHRGKGPISISCLAFLAAVLAGIALARHARWEDLKGNISGPTAAVTSFLTLGALVTFVQFLYKDVYVPSQSRAAVVVTSKLSHARAEGPIRALAADVELEGTNSNSVRVLGSAYTLTGVKMERGRTPAFRRVTVRGYTDPDGFTRGPRSRVGRYSRERGEVLLESGKLLADDYAFEPHERYSVRFLVHVPRSRFDFVRLRTTVIVARSDKLAVGDEVDYPDGRRPVTDKAGGKTLFTTRKIEETSFVRSMTRDERVLVTAWNVQPERTSGDRQPPLFPQLWAYVDRLSDVDGAPSGEDRNIEALSEFYGLAWIDSLYDLPL